jgi:hypothetical protein
MKSLRKLSRFAFAAGLVAVAPLSWAHEDEEHHAPAASASTAPTAAAAPATASQEPEKVIQLETLEKPQVEKAHEYGLYGSREVVGLKAFPAATVVEHIARFDGKLVAVTGKVVDVCPKKGCWMSLEAGEGVTPVFVRFQDYSFFVPRNSQGHQAVLIGRASKTQIDEATARHFLEDAGASQEEIEKVKGPQDTIEIIATSVAMDRPAELDEPWSAPRKAAPTSQPSKKS